MPHNSIMKLRCSSYWPIIDDRLRAAAFERGVRVRLMPSLWKYTSYKMKHYLQSLASINSAVKGSVEVVRPFA